MKFIRTLIDDLLLFAFCCALCFLALKGFFWALKTGRLFFNG